MDESVLEEWELLPESPVPGWEVVEALARAASTAAAGARLLVLEPAKNGAYRTCLDASAPFGWSKDLEATVRKALRRDGLVGLAVRSPGLLTGAIQHYRRVQRRALTGDALASELGGRFRGVEEFLEGAQLLMLAGHDGDPVYLLSRAAMP